MRALVTGAGGFLGGALVARLRERGDTVRAIVRSQSSVGGLQVIGCETLVIDIAEPRVLAPALDGCDAVFHLAGAYEIGMGTRGRHSMFRSNVEATRAVLEATAAAGTPRTVYVSTIGVFGNTRGQVVDESYRRDPADGYLSYYDETKYLAHLAAEEQQAAGRPVIIVQPGQIYGPGDHSAVGRQLAQAHAGRLRTLALADVGLNFGHVDDIASGLVLAHDRGRPGEAYVLGGEIARLREAIALAARLGGRRPPRLTLPTVLLRAVAPLGPLLARPLGFPPDMREVIRAGDGVTYWATDAKARRELGYAPRDLATGLGATFATQG